jgi:hypothetical protein
MNTQRSSEDPVNVARMLIDRYGLRAAAVAEERASEAQTGGAAKGLDHWRQVQSAIAELRRTAPH